MTNSHSSHIKKGAPERFTAQQVADALHAVRGMTTLAARHLGCDPKTIQRYVRTYTSVADALRDEREAVTDIAELALYKAIQEGEPWAVQFYLKTQGRARGYVERQQIDARAEPIPPIPWERVPEDVQIAFLERRITLADVVKQLQ
jgi:hypothetical protein